MRLFFQKIYHYIQESISAISFNASLIKRVNLCSAGQKIPGYVELDFIGTPDLKINLSSGSLPFVDNSLKSVICISAINYFTYERAGEIVAEVYRSLEPGGVARFAVQDLQMLARKYINKDFEFFYQKLPNGHERFEGKTLGDKFVAWFYGYPAKWEPCKYFYDYDSLALLFIEAGFSIVENKKYLESRLEHIELIDNRPEQMFFLEAIK